MLLSHPSHFITSLYPFHISHPNRASDLSIIYLRTASRLSYQPGEWCFFFFLEISGGLVGAWARDHVSNPHHAHPAHLFPYILHVGSHQIFRVLGSFVPSNSLNVVVGVLDLSWVTSDSWEALKICMVHIASVTGFNGSCSCVTRWSRWLNRLTLDKISCRPAQLSKSRFFLQKGHVTASPQLRETVCVCLRTACCDIAVLCLRWVSAMAFHIGLEHTMILRSVFIPQ